MGKLKTFLLSEAVLFEDESLLIRDATPGEIPKYFIHRTDDAASAQGIAQGGFDLRHFGKTAKKYGQLDLMKYDPKGIFAIGMDHPNDFNPNDLRPYVIFTASIQRALILINKTDAANAKQQLSALFGNKTGENLTRDLRAAGYQAVLRPEFEQIILDPSIVKVVSAS